MLIEAVILRVLEHERVGNDFESSLVAAEGDELVVVAPSLQEVQVHKVCADEGHAGRLCRVDGHPVVLVVVVGIHQLVHPRKSRLRRSRDHSPRLLQTHDRVRVQRCKHCCHGLEVVQLQQVLADADEALKDQGSTLDSNREEDLLDHPARHGAEASEQLDQCGGQPVLLRLGPGLVQELARDQRTVGEVVKQGQVLGDLAVVLLTPIELVVCRRQLLQHFHLLAPLLIGENFRLQKLVHVCCQGAKAVLRQHNPGEECNPLHDPLVLTHPLHILGDEHLEDIDDVEADGQDELLAPFFLGGVACSSLGRHVVALHELREKRLDSGEAPECHEECLHELDVLVVDRSQHGDQLVERTSSDHLAPAGHSFSPEQPSFTVFLPDVEQSAVLGVPERRVAQRLARRD
mmetsp:Transcript_20871/g.80107  ORF Transcript_20871/g.80107 Transcript_20871/m.80107 type:complete len:404 (-) Transcript_20871:422-1633(-)